MPAPHSSMPFPPLMDRWTLLALVVLNAPSVRTPHVAAQDVSVRPVRSIADAIARRATDAEVTVGGRAIVSSGKLQTGVFDIAIQDGTGGLRLFSRSPQADVREGDSVIATGAIKTYRGNVELAATNVSVINAPKRTVSAVEIPVDPAVIAQHSGELVRVHGRVTAAGASEGGQWLRLREAAPLSHGTITVWVPANHGAHIDLAHAAKSESLTVTGVVTAYQDNTDDPMVWQIVPRDGRDLRVDEEAAGIARWIIWSASVLALLLVTILLMARISARRQLRVLRETETRYRQLLALLPDAVIVYAKGKILFTNPAASQLLGLPSEGQLVGRSLSDFTHPDSVGVFADHSTGQPTAEPMPRARARMVNATGAVIDVEITSSACVYHDQPAMLLLARDITSQLRYERDLHALALVDDLTGLQNRRAFTLFAEQELARARRHGRTPVLVFADLDGLKQINDRHGHAAGDVALKLVAAALKSIFRETDIVARWSGDEFVAMMVDGSQEAAQTIGARLDAAISQYAPAGLPYAVTASVGASPLDPALPLRDAMERADAELYAQKKRIRRSKIRATPIGIPVVRTDS